ncbi:hypothetical protein [Synechococcus sp. 8F6]|uniref:hypothetical protein n=1 Tax=Synechococcus sp. 8F6 TaxID=2025606 RepID=UPI000B9994E5|nr:hypothetical protein [Synechococcus sp. 8F6]
MESLRVLRPGDLDQVTAVYRDAVISQAQGLYTPVQIAAWSNHATTSNAIKEALQRGYGLASCSQVGQHGQATGQTSPAVIEAFGLLDPVDRLSLLYCRARSCRQGRSSAILRALELYARQQGCRQWRTEASQLSKPLLLRLGWCIDAEETVIFAGESFQRWRMIKTLSPSPGWTGPNAVKTPGG